MSCANQWEKKSIERNWAVRVHIWVGPVEARVEQSRNGLGWIYPKALARALSHRRRAQPTYSCSGGALGETLNLRITNTSPYLYLIQLDTSIHSDTSRYVDLKFNSRYYFLFFEIIPDTTWGCVHSLRFSVTSHLEAQMKLKPVGISALYMPR